MDSLYRFYDKDDVLLYVGISIDPFRRFKQHGSAGKTHIQSGCAFRCNQGDRSTCNTLLRTC